MRNTFNFSAGPAMLPEAVLKQAQEELLDWQGTGMSVMEVSHRSKSFIKLTQHIEKTVRELLTIPDNYHVLFLFGGATLQFSMLPMNLTTGNDCVDYIDTGHWSRKAMKSAKVLTHVNVASELIKRGDQYFLPQQIDLNYNPHAKYVHYTANETIGGIEFHWVPKTINNIPLVSDMTSTIFSQPIDVNDFGVIYAGAQKNFGQAGVTMVIIREDLLTCQREHIPDLLNYKLQAESHSMLNTPPTFSWYMTGLMFDWIQAQGGVEKLSQLCQEKSAKLYNYIDASDYYFNSVDASCRSRLNVPFTLADDALNDKFLQEAEKAHLTHLKGHRSIGGLRASLYLGMPEAGVEQLIAFMKQFVKNYG